MLKFSTHEELFENEGLKKKSAKSGISYGTLKKVYNRGMAAWKTGHRPGTTPQQWAMARVNSYIGKGKGTYYGADSDLSGKGKKESVDEAINAPILKTSKKHDTKHVKQAIGIASDPRYKKGNMTGAVKAMNKISPGLHKHPQVAAVLRKQNEATVKEISKNLAKNYIGKASRDVFHKGRADATQDAIGKLGGKHKDQDYNKGPERKASMRVRGIDRATNRLMKKEAMSDSEKKAHDAAIAAFKMKGGKVKKLPPGYADGYHGKADPGAGIKGMISKADTKDFGTKKKVRSMK
tara:strand:+ start:407 stop:1285 length:879 start_codon:yes stop_codon:yes gene_type:complete